MLQTGKQPMGAAPRHQPVTTCFSVGGILVGARLPGPSSPKGLRFRVVAVKLSSARPAGDAVAVWLHKYGVTMWEPTRSTIAA
jgi:hypothetical protein